MSSKYNSNCHFIFVMFPGGSKSIFRMGCFREIFDNEIENAVVVDYSFWTMNEEERVQLIKSYCKSDFHNILIFLPGVKFKKYIPKSTIVKIREKLDIKSIICYLADGIERQAVNMHITIQTCLEMFDIFDVVYSYDLYECDKYGFVYEALPLKKFEIVGDSVEKPKIFFCGRDKGRLELLSNIARLCEKNNVEYEFLVEADPDTPMEKAYGNINFIEYIQYDNLVEKIVNATCLLSLVAKNNNMTTASYNEAIMYNKKLLTNCKFLAENKHYNAQYMKSFDRENEIDFNWIKDEIKVDYGYHGYFSVNEFLFHIEQDYNRGLLKKCSRYNVALNLQKKIRVDLHFSKIGWITDVTRKNQIFKENQIEAIRICGINADYGMVLEAISKKNGYSKGMVTEDKIEVGLVGKSDPIYAFCIRFNDTENNCKVLYRAFEKNKGWSKWYSGGDWCGSSGCETVFCAMQIIVLDDLF